MRSSWIIVVVLTKNAAYDGKQRRELYGILPQCHSYQNHSKIKVII